MEKLIIKETKKAYEGCISLLLKRFDEQKVVKLIDILSETTSKGDPKPEVVEEMWCTYLHDLEKGVSHIPLLMYDPKRDEIKENKNKMYLPINE